VNLVCSGFTDSEGGRIRHRCRGCNHHFSASVGTVFHDARLDLRQWFLAIYLMGSVENGIRAAQLKAYLGVNYETARNMVRRIRVAIEQDPDFVQRCLLFAQPGGVIEPAPANRNRHPTLHAVVHKFATEEQTLEHLTRVRWPNGPECPKCKNPDVRKIHSKSNGNRPLYQCLPCKRQFTVTSGRFFKSIRHISEWLIAVYLIESNPKGISPKQLQRLLGLSYRTAAYLAGGLRRNEKTRKTLFETYIGYNDLPDRGVQEKVHG
jgi:transposase-like protein